MTPEIQALLRCPICHGALLLAGNSLVCEKRHCYDMARQGHVNFVPNQKDSFYTKALFESRAAVFAAGVFEPVIAALEAAIETYVPAENAVLVDAGCGEGYYAKRVCPQRRMVPTARPATRPFIWAVAKSFTLRRQLVRSLSARWSHRNPITTSATSTARAESSPE